MSDEIEDLIPLCIRWALEKDTMLSFMAKLRLMKWNSEGIT